jgi:hypothetical protein
VTFDYCKRFKEEIIEEEETIKEEEEDYNE